jgi:2-polyprenyl-3-methyl-5-hydroxy-6-metoxy-1,4-benzoquinol methylase
MTTQGVIWKHFQNERQDSFAGSRPRLTFLIRQIAKRSSGRPSVLNVGIGDGYFDRQAKLAGWKIESIDPDEQTVARLRAEGITAHVGSVEKLPQASGSMDFVTVSEVLEHLTDEQSRAGLAEISRVLKPGGRVVGTVPHAEDLIAQQVICPQCGHVFHRWGHQRSLTLPQVRAMLSAQFVIESIGRTAFVDLRGRGILGFLKGTFRIGLAKLGEPIAVPTIWWVARKS